MWSHPGAPEVAYGERWQSGPTGSPQDPVNAHSKTRGPAKHMALAVPFPSSLVLITLSSHSLPPLSLFLFHIKAPRRCCARQPFDVPVIGSEYPLCFPLRFQRGKGRPPRRSGVCAAWMERSAGGASLRQWEKSTAEECEIRGGGLGECGAHREQRGG